MLTLLPASYRPSSLSTSDTILFVMRDKKGRAPDIQVLFDRCPLEVAAVSLRILRSGASSQHVELQADLRRPSTRFAHFRPALRRSASQRSGRAGSLF